MDGKPRYQRWRRLIAMSPAEAYDRLRQAMSARLDLARAHLGFSFAPKLRSADRDAGHFFFDSQSVPSMCALLKQRLPQQAEQIIAQARQICRHRFDLLGYEGIDYGTEIDWHCDCVHKKRAPRRPWFKIHYLDFEEVGDSKVTWELNRHQHLVTLAKAYRLSGREEFSAELLRNGIIGTVTILILSASIGPVLSKLLFAAFRGCGCISCWQIPRRCLPIFARNGFGRWRSMGAILSAIFRLTSRPIPTCWVRQWLCFSSVLCAPKSPRHNAGNCGDGR